MNTDKLMELERKMRKVGPHQEVFGDVIHDWADELAAALRAEQAVGEEQIARELAEIATWHRRMNLELSGKGSEWAAKEMYACRHGKFAETLERALGTAPEEESRAITAMKVTLFEVECWLPSSIAKAVQEACARQSEGVVLVPREPTAEMLEAAGTMRGYGDDSGEATSADADHIEWWKAMLAAAPGGEGEGTA